MKMSFVILTWNRYQFLEKCLGALTKSITDIENSEIIVMDNGSTDNTKAVLAKYTENKLVRVISRDKNYGLNAYKKLFSYAKGKYITIVDDDVLAFPEGLDDIFIDYLQTFTNYGFLALNVIQNEFTNGAKPGPEHYKDETINGKTIEFGPTGGWCTCFRRSDYKKIWWDTLFTKWSMSNCEDGFISAAFWKKLKLKSGIIKNEIYFHASGPYYAKQYGHLDREIEKYRLSGLQTFVDTYQTYYES